jgi:hypothetical protein
MLWCCQEQNDICSVLFCHGTDQTNVMLGYGTQ